MELKVRLRRLLLYAKEAKMFKDSTTLIPKSPWKYAIVFQAILTVIQSNREVTRFIRLTYNLGNKQRVAKKTF